MVCINVIFTQFVWRIVRDIVFTWCILVMFSTLSMGEWVIFDVIGFPHYKREKQGICFFYLRIFFSVMMLVFVK